MDDAEELRRQWNVADLELKTTLHLLATVVMPAEDVQDYKAHAMSLMAEKDRIARQGFNENSDRITPVKHTYQKINDIWRRVRTVRKSN